MEPGTIVAIVVGGLAFAGVIIQSLTSRRTGKENTEVDRFNAAFEAQDTVNKELRDEVKGLKAEVASLNEQIAAQKLELEKVSARYASVSAQMARIKTIVRDWVAILNREWKRHTDEPMPLPSEEDMVLLEITMGTHPT